MNQFTEAHLNNWKSDYLKLTDSNQRYKLIEDNVWSLGDRIGIICISVSYTHLTLPTNREV